MACFLRILKKRLPELKCTQLYIFQEKKSLLTKTDKSRVQPSPPKQNKYNCTLYLVACKIFYCLKIRSVKNILRYLQEQFLKYLRGDSLKTLFVRVKIQNVPNNFGLRQLKINENPELLGTM